jgi:hypothetical protein
MVINKKPQQDFVEVFTVPGAGLEPAHHLSDTGF